MATVTLHGAEFEWLEQGAGSPVVFVHGSASDYRTWDKQIEHFSPHYHTIRYSRRYHYPNAWVGDGSDYTVAHHAHDLTSFLMFLDLGPVHLCGASYGGYVSLMAALDNPGLVKSLVLEEPPIMPLLVSNPDSPLQLLSLLLSDFSAGKSFIRFGMKAFKPAQEAFRAGKMEEGARLFATGVLGKGGFERLPATVKAKVMDNAAALRAELLSPDFPAFPKERARKLTIPTLLVYGDRSPRFFHAISNRLAGLLPAVESVFIPEASHRMHGDNPQAYNAAVSEFLQRIPEMS
jgi:non-heme chloroperoxidase